MYGKIVLVLFILVACGLAAVEYLAPHVWLQLRLGVGGMASVLGAHLFSNSSGSYVVVTLGVREPVYVRFVAVSTSEWMAGPIPPGRKMKYVEMAREEVVIPVESELEPGVHTLVLRIPDDPSATGKLSLCTMNYPVWTNSKGVRLVSVRDKAYPLDSVGVLRLYEEPVIITFSGHISDIYVYRLGGGTRWTVALGISLDPFRRELVELVARGATNDELSAWAERVAEAIYESLLNGTSTAYTPTMREVDRETIERYYRAGALSLVFEFQAHYIAELGVVEARGKVAEYHPNISYRRGAYISGKYDHLQTGLRLFNRGGRDYIVYQNEVLCDNEYAVLVVLGRTPYTEPEVLGAVARDVSLLENILN